MSCQRTNACKPQASLARGNTLDSARYSHQPLWPDDMLFPVVLSNGHAVRAGNSLENTEQTYVTKARNAAQVFRRSRGRRVWHAGQTSYTALSARHAWSSFRPKRFSPRTRPDYSKSAARQNNKLSILRMHIMQTSCLLSARCGSSMTYGLMITLAFSKLQPNLLRSSQSSASMPGSCCIC